MVFKNGDKLICILNFNSSLKIGKEYMLYGTIDDYLIIENDKEDLRWYEPCRFITKDKYRNYLIDDVLDKNSSLVKTYKEISRLIEMRNDNVLTYGETLSEFYEITAKIKEIEFSDEIFEDSFIQKLTEENLR
jgi:hypothetical protein